MTRSLRRPHPQVPNPESRPLLQGPRRARRRSGSVGTPAGPDPEPSGTWRPTGPRWGIQDSPCWAGSGPTTRHTRPLTFTFLASQRPSYPRRHQRAPLPAEAKGGGRTSASPAVAVRRSGPSESVDSELSEFHPTNPYGSGVRWLSSRRGASAPLFTARASQTDDVLSGLPLHHGGCSSAMGRSGLGWAGPRAVKGKRNQGRRLEVPALLFRLLP